MRRGVRPARVWDGYFGNLIEAGQDLDWAGRWTEPFLDRLKAQGAERVLDLRFGTGADLVRLAEAGFDVTGLDFSNVALEQARARVGDRAQLVAADLAASLPFADEGFDAVMASVALHMFPDKVSVHGAGDSEQKRSPPRFRGVISLFGHASADLGEEIIVALNPLREKHVHVGATSTNSNLPANASTRHRHLFHKLHIVPVDGGLSAKVGPPINSLGIDRDGSSNRSRAHAERNGCPDEEREQQKDSGITDSKANR
jgi:SAM-dependent methyltransferase